ncbi:MAG: MraY family glycosyltransferase [Desulfonatronovibrio sp.]
MNSVLQSFTDISVLAVVFFLSFFLSFVCTPTSNKLAKLLGIIDSPCPRKIHETCVPSIGGIAMAVPLFLVAIFFIEWGAEILGFLSGAIIVFLAGVVDDKVNLSPKYKLLLQISAVASFIFFGGVYLQDFGDVLGTGPIFFDAAGPVLTLIAMVGVINSFNLSDGLDGLAAGMSAIACLFFIPFAYAQDNWTYLIILVSLLGTIIAFLRFNTYPAKLFMGDSGSLLLGFVMAASAVVLTQTHASAKGYQPISALIILSLPVADTLYVMFKRILSGRSPVLPDKIHLHHRLMRIGLSHQLTVSSIYCFMLGMGVLAWVIRPMPEYWQFYLILTIYVFLYFFLYMAEQKTVKKNKRLGFNLHLKPQGKVKEKILYWTAEKSKIFFVFFIIFFLGGCVFTPALGSTFNFYILFVLLSVLFLFPWRGEIRVAGIAHAVIFFALYSMILSQNVAYDDFWHDIYLFILSGSALIWVFFRVMNTRRIRVLWPGSFEILLIGMAMVFPIILHYSVFLGFDFRWQMWVSFFQVLPLYLLIKVYLRRNLTKLRYLALFIFICLVILLV